jgi:hypothetical protein
MKAIAALAVISFIGVLFFSTPPYPNETFSQYMNNPEHVTWLTLVCGAICFSCNILMTVFIIKDIK